MRPLAFAHAVAHALAIALVIAVVTAVALPAQTPSGMNVIPRGRYHPLYTSTGGEWVRVKAFALDRQPVSRDDFLTFVQTHPTWQRSSIRPLFADKDYLGDWVSDTSFGDPTLATEAVTSVSWFAARAFCSAQGKRLPTVDEWEYAAAASESVADDTRNAGFRQRLLGLYSRIGSRDAKHGFRDTHGIHDLHGVEWEWTEDFNSVVVPDDSRQTGSGAGTRDHSLFCASAAIGASDPSDFPAFMRYGFRAALSGRSTARSLGFRCAQNLAQ